jgi:hypothetical protein
MKNDPVNAKTLTTQLVMPIPRKAFRSENMTPTRNGCGAGVFV